MMRLISGEGYFRWMWGGAKVIDFPFSKWSICSFHTMFKGVLVNQCLSGKLMLVDYSSVYNSKKPLTLSFVCLR